MNKGMGFVRLLAAASAVLALASCGGGGDAVVTAAPLQLGVVVAGQAGAPVDSGAPVNLALPAGQSIELDANEEVQWTFSVNGSPLFASGTTVVVQGLTITQADLSPSRVVLQTSLNGPTQLPVFVTLTATSTVDLAQVATVDLTVE